MSGKFLLGIGIGIVLSTVCMYTAYSFKLKSDAVNNGDSYIIERASELGMVFAEKTGDEFVPSTEAPQHIYTESPDEIMTESTPEPAIEPTPDPTIEPTPEPTIEPTPEPTIEPTPEPTIEPTPLPTPKPTPVPTRIPTEPPMENYEGYTGIYIPSGSHATSISNKLASAGIISDANEFLNYLIENALTKRLKTGTFYIPNGADFETIVNILRRQ